MNVCEIKNNVMKAFPEEKFFDEEVMNLFGQRLGNFTVTERDNGTFIVSAPLFQGKKRLPNVERIYNPVTHELTRVPLKERT